MSDKDIVLYSFIEIMWVAFLILVLKDAPKESKEKKKIFIYFLLLLPLIIWAIKTYVENPIFF